MPNSNPVKYTIISPNAGTSYEFYLIISKPLKSDMLVRSSTTIKSVIVQEAVKLNGVIHEWVCVFLYGVILIDKF
ncbi:hypothetical protein J1TS3_42200 [Siminovitchia fordii]|uniref:Uncharacterized protein n=1 Tax=Siminovitchia fordii TaxID=254759 RepID=A0ABQ4KBI1_9BACI|nr:hypothetical protein J1TS3_42200 [Siminovitchia fordii]